MAPVWRLGILSALLRISPSIVFIFALVCAIAGGAPLPAPDYARTLAPLLKEHCTKCHGGAKQKGGLDLRSLESALKGGESGPAFVPGNPQESRLINYLHAKSDPHMPPKGQLGEEEIRTIRNWVTNFSKADTPPPTPDALPVGINPRLAIDVLLEKSWIEAELTRAPRIDDATFLRRITLDLLGRIPTLEERERFLAETNSAKRERLVDDLLASKGHARNLAEIFNVILLGREEEEDKSRGDREKHLLPYLRWIFETNRPWNKVGHDLIVARPKTPHERGATWFLYEQDNNANKMATATSAALLGKQVQCAQCHDHPVAPEIEQKHYWGLVAFFDRSINVNTKDGPRVAEKAAGGYAKFANLEGKSSESELVFFTGLKVDEPDGRRDKDALENYLTTPPADWINPPKPSKKGRKPKITTTVEEAPLPRFSRRAELAELAVEKNPAFARAFVNRAWALLMGRGLVHPVDKMTSAYPPSHPELLDWLAADFAAGDYNVRRLFRAILTSRAYALSAVHPAAVRPLPETFARALDKPLPAEALYRSILVALGAEVQEDGTVNGEQDYRETFVGAYPTLFPEVFSPSVQQAMFATNGGSIDGMLRKEELPLVKSLHETESNEAVVKKAFHTILGRAPESSERERGVEFLNGRVDRREEAIRQFLWALFSGAEFRINH
jgi:hypothetical protein